ncbi:coma-domain-containing protein [Penicillium sp. IBT 35674x]|nr:coma-domain-containing protein [Penicillium sp. IBT 35674x]
MFLVKSSVATASTRAMIHNPSQMTRLLRRLHGPETLQLRVAHTKESSFCKIRRMALDLRDRTPGLLNPDPRVSLRSEVHTTQQDQVMGKRYLADILETMGNHVDGLRFAGD